MDADEGYHGKHNRLRILEHWSTSLHAADRNSEVHYNVPEYSDLTFSRQWMWNACYNPSP